MTLRKTVFWIHLGVGVAAAIVILMMSVTGVILTYEMQLNEWARRGYRATPAGADAIPLPAEGAEVYGIVGQTIAGIASVAATVLVWTGLALTWRRFFGARKPVPGSDVIKVVEPLPVRVANRWEPVPVNGHKIPEPGSREV